VIDSHGYAEVVKYCSFMGNDTYGLSYKNYMLPFTFTNLGNVFLGNGTENLHKHI